MRGLGGDRSGATLWERQRWRPAAAVSSALHSVEREGERGFSLTEMLIATVAGVLLLGTLITVLLSYVRSRERLEAQMRLQDDWGKLQFLLDREIQEATPVTAASSVSASCNVGTGSVRLSLEVPGNSNRIVYYTTANGNQLRRCGPVISSNGDLGATVSDALVLDGVVSFTVDSSDPQRPSFLLSLRAPNGVTYTNRSQPSGTAYRSRSIN